MLLIITGSIDGTSDRILKNLKQTAFRFNFDLYKEYEFELTPNYWRITNPTGHSISSETITGLCWWKAFNYTAHDEPFINDELKHIFRELSGWAIRRNLVKGNLPDFHNRFGKIGILEIAKQHFKIPDTLITWGFKSAPPINQAVAKSLSSGLTTSNKALFTTAIDTNRLDPRFPWFLQSKVDAIADTTVFICGSKLFCFDRDRSGLNGLDWRAEQNFSNYEEEWILKGLTEKEDSSIRRFCRDLAVAWGRIDLLRTRDGELVFLEYNANGQWVFLDYSNKYGLVDTVVEYLTKQNK